MSFESIEKDNEISNFNENNSDFQNQLAITLEKNENNPKLKELASYLDSYKKNYKKSIDTRIEMKNSSFLNNIFSNLQKLLSEVCYIESKEIFEQKLISVYNWFTKTFNTYKTLSQIKYHTDPAPDQKLTEEELNVDNKDYQEKMNELFIARHNEVSHRTILNDVQRPGDLIMSMKTRHIRKPEVIQPKKLIDTKENKDTRENKGKEILSSSMGMKSTFYSTSKSFSNIFTGNTNMAMNKTKTVIYEPKKEIKSSYSYTRPKYTFQQLSVEQMINSQRNKELNDKRMNEELKQSLNEFGNNKSTYKSNLQKKYELSKIIELYDKKISERDDERENNDKINGEENEEDLIEYFHNQKNPQRNRSSASIHFLQRKKTSEMIKSPQRTLMRTFSTVQAPQMQKEETRKEKIIVDNIQNVNKKNYVYKSSNEKKFDVKIKIDQKEAKNKNYQYKNEKEEDIPNDLLIKEKNNNGILNARVSNHDLCSFKHHAPLKKNYHNYYNPLSGYDSMNYHNFYNERLIYERNRNNRINFNNRASMTCVDFAKNNFNHENYLEMRSTMDNFKINELKKLKSSRSLSKRIVIKNTKLRSKGDNVIDENINFLSLQEAFTNPTKQVTYPKLFLPRSGSGLLPLPSDMANQSKKKKAANSQQ